MKKISKSIISITMTALIFSFSFAISTPVLAQGLADNLLWGGQEAQVEGTLGLGNEDPRVIAARVVNVILGFLGIIAVILILYGGFKWMTAAGNEDAISDAKGIIAAGVIGLVIILAAWGLASFVIDALYGATNAFG